MCPAMRPAGFTVNPQDSVTKSHGIKLKSYDGLMLFLKAWLVGWTGLVAMCWVWFRFVN